MVTDHLPTQLTSFIGRRQELSEIAALLTDPACRLLTLVGPGGIGKTRLALEATHTLDFHNGVHFVPLQPVIDTALLPIAIANAIGIQFFGTDEPRVQLVEYLQERQTLLILDNFEHLIDNVDFVVELLSAPGVKLLISSRTTLNVQAEWRYIVSGLNFPNDAHEIENFDAVKLFTERARRLRYDFSLSDHLADVIRICQLTEGMPLALELAAGWLKALSCAEIANEIQRGLDFLAADMRDVPERHRSMAAAFEQSWRMLSDDEQTVFQRVSVFRGGFTREAAEKVADATLRILVSLIDKSLLWVSAAGRYDIHELLRQYGEAKLMALGEAEVIRDTHSNYYLDFLAERDAKVKGRGQIAALDEIEADFDNVRAAWHYALIQRNAIAISRAVEALSWFCDIRNRFLEHEALYTRAQEQFAPLPGEPPPLVWIQLMMRRAALTMEYDPSDEKEALFRSFYQLNLDIVRLHNDPFEIAYITYRWGEFLARTEGWDEFLASTENLNALAPLEHSLSSFQVLEDEFYISQCWLWIGRHHLNAYHMESFFHNLQRSADLKLRVGDKNGVGCILLLMGIIHYNLGHFTEGEQAVREALRLFHEVVNKSLIGNSIYHLARQAFWKGDLEAAGDLVAEAFKYIVIVRDAYVDLSAGELRAYINCMIDEDYEQSLRLSKDLIKNWSRRLNFLELITLCGLGHFEQAKQQLSVILRRTKGNLNAFVTTQVLTVAAIIQANQDEQGRAVEIFSLLFAQPIERVGWVKRWGLVTRLLVRLQADLGEQAYADGWERGGHFNLEVTFAEIITEFGESIDLPNPNHALTDPLTPRELDVLRLVAQGRSNRQIAHDLILALGTVKAYIHTIYHKLDAESRVQAVTRARELHLL